MTKKQDRNFNTYQRDRSSYSVSSKSHLYASNASQSLERLTSSHEAIAWETIGLLEDAAVQEVLKL
tara:strand:+ start:328 stop:525 length:198 start_codon:yes stop_codon:yes gene_type:complete